MVESAAIALFDPIYVEDQEKAIFEGKAAGIETAVDGTIPVEVRVVDAPLPLLKTKTLKRCTESSSPMALVVSSGKVIITDFGDTEAQVSLNVEMGRYLCQVYAQESGLYIFVLAKNADEEVPAVEEIERLEC